MARLPRLNLPGQVHHLIQRGNNRQPIFQDAQDLEAFKTFLGDQAKAHRVALHAYVLMGNHFHLLATPATGDSLPKLMQSLGRSYVRHYNQRTGRSGTLWEGRYRSTVLQAEAWLLPCMAYLDLNPVREGLAEQPAGYAWSSHRHYVGQGSDRLLTPHPLVWQLGNTPFAREMAYSELVGRGVSAAEVHKLTDSLLHGWALGDDGFLAELAATTGRRLARGKAGRPRKLISVPDISASERMV